jgi:hypothetical protein
MKNLKNWMLVAGGCLFAVALMSNAARAEYTSSNTRMPSPMYRSANPVVYGPYVVDSFFDVFTELQRFPEPTSTEVHSFFDVFTELSIQGPGIAPGIRDAPSQQTMRLNGSPPGTPYPHIINTEMLQLDISGGGLPGGVRIRESPTLASMGKTTILADTPSGPFHIDSFFDVFTELSIDGGQTWIPSGSAMHIVGNTPEPSSVMLALLGALSLSGFGVRRGNR